MTDITSIPPRSLTPIFFTQIAQHFVFLKEQHGFMPVYGFATRRNERVFITRPPEHLSAISEPFEATYRYETPTRDLKFTFDSQTMLLNCFVTYDQIYRMTLCDLHHAITPSRDVNYQESTLQIPIETEDDIINGVKALRDILEADLATYLNPPEDLMETVKEDKTCILTNLEEERIENLYATPLEKARLKACEAFENGDYKRTIMFFRPHQDVLCEDDKMILALAFERLQE